MVVRVEIWGQEGKRNTLSGGGGGGRTSGQAGCGFGGRNSVLMLLPPAALALLMPVAVAAIDGRTD